MTQYKLHLNNWRRTRAFSLLEMASVLVIMALVLVAIISIYNGTQGAVASINRNLDNGILPREILQRLAEDLDRLAWPGFDTTVSLKAKYVNDFTLCQLVIESKYYDNAQKPKTFEKIIWQTEYDPYQQALVLYRCHTGLTLEDPVIDTQYAELNQNKTELFVPLCSGLTLFRIQAFENDRLTSIWTKPEPPTAINAALSFATPIETTDGGRLIPEQDQFVRTIAINRSRKIPYKFVKKQLDTADLEKTEPNSTSTAGQGAPKSGKTETGRKDKTETKPAPKPDSNAPASPRPVNPPIKRPLKL